MCIRDRVPENLLVAPASGVHYVPFGVLTVPSSSEKPNHLVDSTDIQVVPALRFFSAENAIKHQSIAVVTTEELDAELPVGDFNHLAGRNWSEEFVALPWARDEARLITSMFSESQSKVISGKSASFSSLERLARDDYDIVHFATHGHYSHDRGDMVGLVLNSSRGEEPEFVPWQSLGQLGFTAELVVLNGCETALGQQLDGEGVLGLNRAFLGAGTKSTLSTLWRVADLSLIHI